MKSRGNGFMHLDQPVEPRKAFEAVFQVLKEQKLRANKALCKICPAKEMVIDPLRRFFNHTYCICVIDSNGYIQFANDMFRDLFGYSQIELIGEEAKILSGFESIEDTMASRQEIDLSLKRSNSWAGYLLDRHQNGSTFESIATIHQIRNGSRIIIREPLKSCHSKKPFSYCVISGQVFVACNDAHLAFTGYDNDEILYNTEVFLNSCVIPIRNAQLICAHLEKYGHWTSIAKIRLKNGQIKTVGVSVDHFNVFDTNYYFTVYYPI